MNFKNILLTLFLGLLGGGAAAAVSPGGLLSPGWLTAGLLVAGAWYLLHWAWQAAGGSKTLAWLAALAFGLRLGLGLALIIILPLAGSDAETHRAGYIFFDAFHRDGQAWALAQSGQPLGAAFNQNYSMDQYGGLLWLSALLYRFLSPDAHRPILIVILGAFTAALGVIFLYRATRGRFDAKIAAAAGWVYTLYPESVLQGASQMREPFLMGLSAVAFWAVASLRGSVKRAKFVFILALSLLALALFSWRAALPIAGVLALWFWLENMADRPGKAGRWIFWGGVIVASVAALWFSWGWLHEAAAWDATLTERSSGMIQAQLKRLPEVLQTPFIVAYGLTQPVLPAALFEKALPVNRVISTWRALGWYTLLPLLIYAAFAVWRSIKTDRRVLILTALAAWGWVLISSIRAGGDLWDNPRYRTIFIVWLALLAGWGWVRARQTHDPWLWRILVMEGIFLAFFTHWYVIRYFSLGTKLPFFTMIGLIAGLSVLFLAGCAAWDYWKRRRAKRIADR